LLRKRLHAHWRPVLSRWPILRSREHVCALRRKRRVLHRPFMHSGRRRRLHILRANHHKGARSPSPNYHAATPTDNRIHRRRQLHDILLDRTLEVLQLLLDRLPSKKYSDLHHNHLHHNLHHHRNRHRTGVVHLRRSQQDADFLHAGRGYLAG
jgi:hypothetical protein